MGLLAEKYGDDLVDHNESGGAEDHENPVKSASGCASDAAADEEEDDGHDSDREVLESKARGRHQLQDANLRIKKLETILKFRKDLTKQQRRKLQSRKNTAIFRERIKNAQRQKEFITIDLRDI